MQFELKPLAMMLRAAAIAVVLLLAISVSGCFEEGPTTVSIDGRDGVVVYHHDFSEGSGNWGTVVTGLSNEEVPGDAWVFGGGLERRLVRLKRQR